MVNSRKARVFFSETDYIIKKIITKEGLSPHRSTGITKAALSRTFNLEETY